MSLISVLAADVGALLYPGVARSQSVITERNRIDRRAPQASARRRRTPRRPRRSTRTTQAFQPFVLEGVHIDGASASADRLAPAWAKFLGHPVGRPEVNSIADAVAAIYAASDVALYSVEVPDQPFTGPTLRLQVTEDRVSSVVVDADQGVHLTPLIQRLAAEILRERPLSRSAYERFVALVAAIPGVTAEAKFVDAGSPGEVVLHLAVHQTRVHVTFGANDTGQAALGRDQLEASVSVFSLFRAGDETQVYTLDSPGSDRLRYVSLAYIQPLFGGATLQGNVGYLATRVGAIRGTATSGGFQASYPLHLSTETALTATLGFDLLNVDGAYLENGFASDHTRAARVSLAYSRAVARDAFVAGLSLSQGVDAFGARIALPGAADKSFTKLSYTASFDRVLDPRWVVRIRSKGQISADLLPSAEQMALGGPTAGRAFDSSAGMGDDGVYASAEIARTFGPKPGAPAPASELYAFADAGYVRLRPRPGVAGLDQHLASIGLGLRVMPVKTLVLELEGARALSQQLYPQQHDWRVNVSVRVGF